MHRPLSDFMMLLLILVVHIPLVISLTRWEKRTLECNVDDCLLSIKGGAFQHTNCSLNGADKDSVISKSPPNNRKCIRFYSYNTKKTANGWTIWRSKSCAREKIILEVHCGFPSDN